jgi:hypothetical protein
MQPKKPEVYIGIDPGVSGAYACLSEEGTIHGAHNWESIEISIATLNDIRRDYDVRLAVLEHVHAFPKQGVSSVFTFGTNFGIWQGVLQALQLPHILVTPSRWQGAVFDSNKKVDGEKLSVAFINRRFPGLNLKKSHHGKADALCMAIYARFVAAEQRL